MGTEDFFEDSSTLASQIMSKNHERTALLEIMDYDDGGPNNKHDQRRGRPTTSVTSP
ncbi:hypothetical protein HPP92_003889 [Vanilla planifolia]|uniref:Uncharacterized protein n=1 Tax=Vanilla planifolia TaxID=51239 RepID=A0A835RYH3_VANPL|nr:hypothetical protein HPP92_003889 [Vanilla planifolia]